MTGGKTPPVTDGVLPNYADKAADEKEVKEGGSPLPSMLEAETQIGQKEKCTADDVTADTLSDKY